jgi:hypothetical protein
VALKARTRYRYVLLPANPVFTKLVMLAPTCAICAKFEQLLLRQRSIRKPDSLFELSVH